MLHLLKLLRRPAFFPSVAPKRRTSLFVLLVHFGVLDIFCPKVVLLEMGRNKCVNENQPVIYNCLGGSLLCLAFLLRGFVGTRRLRVLLRFLGTDSVFERFLCLFHKSRSWRHVLVDFRSQNL